MSEDEEADFISFKKLSQFYGVVKRNECHEALSWTINKNQMNMELEKIIREDGDVNCQFPHYNFVTSRNPQLAGCTALHLAVGQNNESIVRTLLVQGANFTKKNCENQTALHVAVGKCFGDYKNRWRLKGKLENTIVDLILSAHVEFKVRDNPCDKIDLSHLHIACMANHSRAVEFFLAAGVSVGHAVNIDSSVFPGYTPLHFAVRCCALETIELLIKHGAELNVEEASGMTPMKLLLEKNMAIVDLVHKVDNADSSWHYKVPKLMLDLETNKKIMELLLRHAMNFGSSMNFDNSGLSQLHIASTVQNMPLVEHLLSKVEDVNCFVDINSPFWPGYTALHFAAHFDVEAVKFLLQKGANLEAKDANGLTPFDICLERYKVEDLHFILSSKSAWKNILLTDGKTKLLDIVATMQNVDALDNFFKNVESYKGLSVPSDSPLWPGYTPLHLAINFSETVKIFTDHERKTEYTRKDFEELESVYIKRVNVCLENGADVTVSDACGWTVLHLAYRVQKEKVVKLLMQEHTKAVNPIDTDNLSHLYIACAFNYPRVMKRLLANDDASVNVKIKSTFQWRQNQKYFARRNKKEPHFFVTAGSTPLHVAVTCEVPELVRILLEHKANVNAKDSNGITPLHRTLVCRNPGKVGNILLSLPNLYEYTFYGLNYLHFAAYFSTEEKVLNRLIRLGADVNSTIEFKTNSKENKFSNMNVEKLFPGMVVSSNELNLAQPLSFMYDYNKFRPLDNAIRRNQRQVAKILLQLGADIFAMRPDGWTVLQGALLGGYCHDLVVPMLKRDVTLQKRLQEESGVTMLHLACKEYNVDDVRYFLKIGMDVNAQVKLDCPLWTGCSPLHVLTLQIGKQGSRDKIIAIVELLLESGADVTLMNAEGNTPIHRTEIGWDSISYGFFASLPFTSMLLKSLKDFNVNPKNLDCISHFHIACLRSDLDVMEQFLRFGADVNQPVSFYSSKFPGCTPLHLVLDHEAMTDNDLRLEAIDLLLNHGADVRIGDLYDNSVLHSVIKWKSQRRRIFEKLVSAGIDINVKNVFGETPFGMLLCSRNFEYEDIRFFLNHGCHVNVFDSLREEGYLTIFFTRNHPQKLGFENPLLKRIIKIPSIKKLDDSGRNAIHNVVSCKYAFIKDYADVIGFLMKQGCNVDHQDNLGRTALHIAIEFENNDAVIGLLRAGADINIIDKEGRSAFSYVLSFSRNLENHQFEFQYKRIFRAFAIHVRKLQMLGLYVNELNREMLDEVLKKWSFDKRRVNLAQDELKRMRDLKIGSTQFSLCDFLLDTEAVSATFRGMTLSERRTVDIFFKSMRKRDFRQLRYLLRIQYEKVLKKLSLTE